MNLALVNRSKSSQSSFKQGETKMQTTKNRPVKIKTSEKRDDSLPSRKTRKSTQEAKLETLRRKTIRNLKQGKI